MKKYFNQRALILMSLLLLYFPTVTSQNIKKLNRVLADKLKTWENPFPDWKNIAKPKIDSVLINKTADTISLFFAQGLSYYPFREDSYELLIRSLKKSIGRRFKRYELNVVSDNHTISELIPNIYRRTIPVDSGRFPATRKTNPVLVRKIDVPEPVKGLSHNSIALWHSHGYYFEMNLDRWEWQRARLFGTVEDIAVMSYVQPYLTKMLENAGANVFLPRERDTQTNEVIVDNDRSSGSSEVVLHLNNNVSESGEGFLLTDTLYPGYNPFKNGTSLRILNDSATYIPDIPERGSYAVYISYPVKPDNDTAVVYSVSHSGGKTHFIVNQTIGGETWIYLGTFQFDKGKDVRKGSVIVRGSGKNNRYIALDAIRFGGGMGNVARKPSAQIIKNQLSVNENQSLKISKTQADSSSFKWKLSGKPRFLEGARYYLQYAGMPDTSVYSPNNSKNDYNDDYQSRGAWVNFLIASPQSQGKNQAPAGMGIPVDLSLAFHTDAGITPNDSVIGTLGIYSTGANNGKFPDGTSRLASRDLSDMIQSQVVDDIRIKFDPKWTRRGLWDKPYSEARRPDVPAMLIELLSHQNRADQQYGLDPRFRFQVSRSVYIGILKYLSYVEKRKYVVQPLPVKDFAILPGPGKTVHLSWNPSVDNTEPSSRPDKYLIYKRTGDNGFGNGVIVENTSADVELDSWDTIYSFKITALNEGGESFDSEILSVGLSRESKDKVLIVNGFDRVSGPAWFDEKKMSGIAWWKDRGVADHYDISSVGDQYDFDRSSAWLDDDSPGWGASYSDNEGRVLPGNSFDYPYIHGKAILAAGESFCSVSNSWFCTAGTSLSSFKTVDIILGEEKSTPFFNDTSRYDFRIYTPAFMERLAGLTEARTNIFISGAYVGSDMIIPGDSSAIKFSSRYLHFLPRTGHAVKNGSVYSTDYAKPVFTGEFHFNTAYSKDIYSVEAPDAIEPSGKGAVCVYRYSENNTSAGVAYNGDYKTVIMGFPFETILSEQERNRIMKQILMYFKK